MTRKIEEKQTFLNDWIDKRVWKIFGSRSGDMIRHNPNHDPTAWGWRFESTLLNARKGLFRFPKRPQLDTLASRSHPEFRLRKSSWRPNPNPNLRMTTPLDFFFWSRPSTSPNPTDGIAIAIAIELCLTNSTPIPFSFRCFSTFQCISIESKMT